MPRVLLTLLVLLASLPLRAQTPASAQPPSQDRLVQLLKELTEAPSSRLRRSRRKIMTDRFKPSPTTSLTTASVPSSPARQLRPRIMLDAPWMNSAAWFAAFARRSSHADARLLVERRPSRSTMGHHRLQGSVLAVTDIWDAHIAPHGAQASRPTAGSLPRHRRAFHRGLAALGITPVTPSSRFGLRRSRQQSLPRQSLG